MTSPIHGSKEESSMQPLPPLKIALPAESRKSEMSRLSSKEIDLNPDSESVHSNAARMEGGVETEKLKKMVMNPGHPNEKVSTIFAAFFFEGPPTGINLATQRNLKHAFNDTPLLKEKMAHLENKIKNFMSK